MKIEDKKNEHTSAYYDQIIDFRKCFERFREKKIVLYGIGRYTATILNALSEEFCFVGLMDKDPKKIGSTLRGFEIISLREVEDRADIIIICTTRTYWRIIFSRIKSTCLQVYFLNGDLAEDSVDNDYSNNPYWEMNEEKIYLLSKEYDIVSFDIFDTLITRIVLSSTDVFFLLEERANEVGVYGDICRVILNCTVWYDSGNR